MTVRLLLLPPKAMLPTGNRDDDVELAVSNSEDAVVSTSLMLKAMGPLLPLVGIVWFGIAVIVGAVLTEVTVTANVRVTVLLAACPSSTVTVTVALPFAFAVGVNLKLPVEFGLA